MLWWLVENTIFAGLLAIVVAAFCALFRPRPAIRHAMWLVVLLKLVAPPLPYVRWQLPDAGWLAQSESDDAPIPTAGSAAPQHDNIHEASQRVALAHDFVAPTDSSGEDLHVVDSPPAHAGSPEMEPEQGIIESIEYVVVQADPVEPVQTFTSPPQPPADASNASSFDVSVFATSIFDGRQANRTAGYLWMFSVVVMAVYEAGRAVRFRRLVQSAGPASGWLVQQVEDAARRLGVRAPQVVVVAGTCTPVLWTLGRPRLLWPQQLTARLSTSAVQAVIVHELAHLARRDHWVRRLELAAGCGWWWHPLFWIVRRQLRENAELACDAWVVSAYPAARRAYARALIEVIDFTQQRALPASALGAGDVTRRTFERRLRMIMRERVPSRVSLAAAVALLLACVIVLPGFSSGQDVSSSDDQPPSTFPDAGDSANVLDEAAGSADLSGGDAVDFAIPGDSADAVDSTIEDLSFGDFNSAASDIGDIPGNADIADYAAAPANDDDAPAGLNASRGHDPTDIRRLERQLEQFMKEVRALRSAAQNGANRPSAQPGNPFAANTPIGLPGPAAMPAGRSQTPNPLQPPASPARPRIAQGGRTLSGVAQTDPSSAPPAARLNSGTSVDTLDGGSGWLSGPSQPGNYASSGGRYESLGGTNVRVLTRVTYRLPAGKAQALAALLDEHAGDRVESKVRGQVLIVTAEAEDQEVVGRFLALISSAASTTPAQANPEAGLYSPLIDPSASKAAPPDTGGLPDEPVESAPADPSQDPFGAGVAEPLDALEPTVDDANSDPFGFSTGEPF